MEFPYLQRLRVRLQERANEVRRMNHVTYAGTLEYFLNEARDMPPVAEILALLESNALYSEDLFQFEQFKMPTDALGRAVTQYKAVQELTKGGNRILFSIARGERNIDATLRTFVDQIFNPFYRYLDEHLDDTDFLLTLLWRYKRAVDWFEHARLWEQHIALSGTRKQEEALDRDVRRYLLAQGIGFPFSQPHSPRGRADIVFVHSDKPLPLEIKLFDGDKDYIRTGFAQALDYAEKYGEPCGYLVVFSVKENTFLSFSTQPDEGVARFEHQGKTIFCIPIQLAPTEAPSSRGALPTITLQLADLT